MSCIGLVLLFAGSCKGNQEKLKEPAIVQKSSSLPVIEFTRQYIDLGTLIDGEKTGVDFTYVNKGGSDLLVLSCQTSCGCTAPSFSKQPLPAGDTASIRLIFDSSGTRGIQNKSAHVITNARNSEVDIVISALVIENNK